MQLRKEVRGKIANEGALRTAINAAVITELAPVNLFTKIVVLDSRGSGAAKALARMVCAEGYQGYLAKGGFAAWRRAGLPVKEGGSYRVSPGAPVGADLWL